MKPSRTKPATVGIASETSTSHGNRLPIRRMLLVLVQLGRVALPVGLALGLEQPAGVRVPEAAQTAAVTDVRAVRVALLVGVRVVLAVVGDPVEHRALDRSEPRTANVRSSHG